MLSSLSRASAACASSDWDEIISVPAGYSAAHTAATYTPGKAVERDATAHSSRSVAAFDEESDAEDEIFAAAEGGAVM